jgi:hypothetical protein
MNIGFVVIIIVAAVAALLIAVLVPVTVHLRWRRRRRHHKKSSSKVSTAAAASAATGTCVAGIYGTNGTSTTPCCPSGGRELCDLYHYCTGQPNGNYCGWGLCDGVCASGICGNDRLCTDCAGYTVAGCETACGKEGLTGACYSSGCGCTGVDGGSHCDNSICAQNNTCAAGSVSQCSSSGSGCECVPVCTQTSCSNQCGANGFNGSCSAESCECDENGFCSDSICAAHTSCPAGSVAQCSDPHSGGCVCCNPETCSEACSQWGGGLCLQGQCVCDAA